MLTHIYIKNFAIIREIDIDLLDGLNIISGETGTGKSIVIQAISLALGGRGSSSLIAADADRALVQLVFSPEEETLQRLQALPELARFLPPDDPTLIISREFQRSGKSLSRINGEIVTLATLSSLTGLLVDIHGQYDNQTFLNPDAHIRILDSCGDAALFSVKEQLADTYEEYRKIRTRLLQLRSDRAEFLRKQDFLRFERDEIQAAQLHENEDTELEEQRRMLQNSEKIFSALSESYEILSGADLERCQTLLEGIADLHPDYGALSSGLAENLPILRDLTEEIRSAKERITFAPTDIDRVMNRLGQIDMLKRKYGGGEATVSAVLEYQKRCEAELLQFSDSEDNEKELTLRLSGLHKELLSLSEELSRLRRIAAEKLSVNMTAELSALNFSNAQFEVSLQPHCNAKGAPVLSADGTDLVTFLFNANKGGTLKPLSEVASGGEISRIALAFKRLTNAAGNVATLIFDEIDTGISGITASVVGKKLHEIAERHQVLCITHLPQIAACGDHQYLISKNDTDNRSYTTLALLSEKERIHEIARLLGGTNITETTLASAAELLGFSHKQ